MPWQLKECHINFSEMAAMVFALHLWKLDFKGTSVAVWTDNEPAMWWMIKKTVKLPLVGTHMPLIRYVCLACVRTPFRFWANHVAGEENVIADALSRGSVPDELDPEKRDRFHAGRLVRELQLY